MNAAQHSRPAAQASAAPGRTMMQAIVQHRYGTEPRDVLKLDRGTWHVMAGQPYLMRLLGFGLRGPKNQVPGMDVAGTVIATGADVTGFRACAPAASTQGRRSWSSVPQEASAAMPCNSPRPSERRSPAYAAPGRRTWS